MLRLLLGWHRSRQLLSLFYANLKGASSMSSETSGWRNWGRSCRCWAEGDKFSMLHYHLISHSTPCPIVAKVNASHGFSMGLRG